MLRKGKLRSFSVYNIGGLSSLHLAIAKKIRTDLTAAHTDFSTFLDSSFTMVGGN